MAAPRFGRLDEGLARPASGTETIQDILAHPSGARVERILSLAASSPAAGWYEQDWDEFVLVVAGAALLAFADDGAERRMEAGDWALLPAGCRHRVAWTEPGRETLWLAVHLPRRDTRADVSGAPDRI